MLSKNDERKIANASSKRKSKNQIGYRNKIFFIAFDGFAVDSEEFTNLCTDINLLHALGIKIVLVHGIRPFIDQRLSLGKIDSKFHKNQRITTSSMMPHVIETNGLVRTKIEAA